MAAYFDISKPEVISLIPESIACRSDLAFLASGAEAEIVLHYTRQEEDTRGTILTSRVVTGNENLTVSSTDPVVYLRYYKADADLLTSADELLFKTAMRRAVAALIRLRAAQEDIDPLVSSESRGRRSVSYWRGADVFDSGVPRTVTKWLKAYDMRPVSYVI